MGKWKTQRQKEEGTETKLGAAAENVFCFSIIREYSPFPPAFFFFFKQIGATYKLFLFPPDKVTWGVFYARGDSRPGGFSFRVTKRIFPTLLEPGVAQTCMDPSSPGSSLSKMSLDFKGHI